MPQIGKLRPSVLFLSLLAALPLAARADASSIVSSSTVSLNSLRYELIDLDPNDGITPAVSFNIDTFAGEELIDANQNFSTVGLRQAGTLQPGTTLSYKSTDGSSESTATSDSFSVQTKLTFGQLLAGEVPSSPSSYFAAGTLAETGNTSPGGHFGLDVATFTLTPNTELVMLGDASITRALDGQALADWATSNGYGQWSLSNANGLQIVVGGLASKVDLTGGAYLLGPEAYSAFNSSPLDLINQDATTLQQTSTVSQPLRLVFSNGQATPATGDWFIGVGNSDAIGATVGNNIVLPPVDPSPSPPPMP